MSTSIDMPYVLGVYGTYMVSTTKLHYWNARGSLIYIGIEKVNVGYYGAQSELHDVKCDAWSLGAMPHILLGGRVPFGGAPLKGKQSSALCLTLWASLEAVGETYIAECRGKCQGMRNT
ncbi:hypothetical protein TcYC6_0120980 [Trypanosoma cruzi]|nr:hypothetical protein TcYC6_0120980 [Trypanosoma cruzi]